MPSPRLNPIALVACLTLSACESGGPAAESPTTDAVSSDGTAVASSTTGVGASSTSSNTATLQPTSSTGHSSATVTSTASTSSSSATTTSSRSTSEPADTETGRDPSSSEQQSSDDSEATTSAAQTDETESTSSAPQATDACATAVLCDDFDDDTVGMPPGAPWTTDVNGGGVEISDERAFSGAKSVHVSNTEGAFKRAYFSVEGAPVFPAVGAEMYGRMMMWLEATPAGSVHWTFIQGEGPSADSTYDIFYRYGGQHEGKLMANFETQGKATDCWDHSATVMPTQTWACLEWRFNTSTDEMQFWLDDAEVTDIHTTGMGEGCVSQDLAGAWPAPAQFELLRLGWEKYQQSSALNAWIDDVAVSTSRVGCPELP